jgi:AraC-like DNA-binding protein
MTGLEIFELLARGAAIGAVGATAAAFARASEPGARGVRVAGLLFCLNVVAYAINSSPLVRAAVPSSVLWPIHVASLPGGGLFWLFIVTLFEDRKLKPVLFVPTAALIAVGVVAMATPVFIARHVWVVHNLIELGLAAHGLYVIQRSWRGDLVEARRRLRGPFLAIVTAFIATLSMFEIGESFGIEADWYGPAGALALALFCGAGAFVFTEARPTLFGAALAAPALASDGLDAGDRATLARLDAAMGAGEAWRREGLTIGALAEEVGAPEHRLRRLINDHLGHRNFAAFVNARRIEVAKARLSDPNEARVTVAAIAFDLGFGSLGPFNRAFKEATGLTPTEWRRSGDKSSPNSENPG